MGIWRRESPVFDSHVKKNKAEICRDERLLDIEGLFHEDDEQPNMLTDAQVVQQQMREFNRLLAKGKKERQGKRSATSCVCGDMVPSPDQLSDVKPSQITVLYVERPQQIDPRISMNLRRYVERWRQCNSC